MIKKAKRFAVVYLYLSAVFGGLAWGSYFLIDAFYQSEKETAAEQRDYKK